MYPPEIVLGFLLTLLTIQAYQIVPCEPSCKSAELLAFVYQARKSD